MIESGSVPEAGPWPRIRMESSSGLVSPPNSRHRHANLGRMQITFHNLLPVPEFIAPILPFLLHFSAMFTASKFRSPHLLSLFLRFNSPLLFFLPIFLFLQIICLAKQGGGSIWRNRARVCFLLWKHGMDS